ncbi:hypothetical protein ACH4MN_23535 [Streptomyces anulatus]|uniref:hypothetical protein n=1 Tax=Streptomyces TaxID=1883 RepID=UPI000851D6CC|nr:MULTISPECIES: hypothetical protein [Streptomyces]MBQ1106219.1 hypothetical protein [Streptomyces sp. 404i]MBQ1111693.1 hypothetical protein [Streptomyces sp. C3-3]MDX3489783.1 hypothetical protein [Streptomyces sp. ID05-18]WIY78372.1 hypothetical protein QPM16_23830 [Streptomyces anulatus]
MSLLELIERADERALAAGALACLDRCLPLLAGPGAEPLRPLWASCENGQDWAIRLAAVRTGMEHASVTDGPAALVRTMLGAAPSDFAAVPLREWADACSLVALRIHGRLDAPDGDPTPDEEHLLKAARSGEPAAVGPLVAGELERQVRILEILAETTGTAGSGAGLRKALDLSTEGRRVLRAVMSRRARGRG